MLLTCLPGLVVSLCAISGSMYLSNNENADQRATGHILFMISIIVYLLIFSMGLSSTPWVINSEIYPIHLVGTAVALATATNWISNFIVASVFLSAMSTDMGKVFTFLVLAVFALAATLFVAFVVPETGGKRV